MSSYEISTVAGLAAAAQALTRDGTVIVPINGRAATIRFQNDSLPSMNAANNVLVTVRNLNNSADFGQHLSESGPASFIINVTTSTLGLPSSGTTLYNTGIINININDIDREYLTTDGHWEKFTLQHIVNHEIMHAITGLDDSPRFIDIVNIVNEQTQAGPYRYSYEDARCFISGTPITLSDNTESFIELVRPGDVVLAFDPAADGGCGALIPRMVTKIFHNTARQIIDLRGLRCTLGHVFLTGGINGKSNFSTIFNILRDDGVLVEKSGESVRARTGAKLITANDLIVKIIYRSHANFDLLSEKRRAIVRAGIPIPATADCHGKLLMPTCTLAQYLEAHNVAILSNGNLCTADGIQYSALDWPEGSTPFDTHEARNWIVEADGKPYTPPWIRDLVEEDETQGLRVVGAMPLVAGTPSTIQAPL